MRRLSGSGLIKPLENIVVLQNQQFIPGEELETKLQCYA
jgi:hypothetical protein